MTTQLNDLTHASRDGKTTLCEKPVFPGITVSNDKKPRMVRFDGFTKLFWSVPGCRTCREAIKENEYLVKP